MIQHKRVLKALTLVCFVLLFQQECQAQTKESFKKKEGYIFGLNKKLSIRRLTIVDTAFKNSIARFIENQTSKDSALERYGYLELRQISPSGRFTKEYCFHLSIRYYYFYSDFADDRFPLFYTIVNNKPVLIYLNNSQRTINYRIKNKSKKRFIGLINRELPKIEKQTIITETGKKVLLPVGQAVTEGISSINICKASGNLASE